MKRKRPDADTVKQLYIRWLKSEDLRSIAASQPYPVSHSTISTWFRRQYGPDATDPIALSLQRSLLEDYPPGHELHESTLEWVLNNMDCRTTSQMRSRHSMQQLAKWQVVHEDKMLEYLTPTSGDPWDQYDSCLDFLRLPLYSLMLDNVHMQLLTGVEDERSA